MANDDDLFESSDQEEDEWDDFGEDEDKPEICEVLTIGATWACWQTAVKNKIQDDLQKTFWQDRGKMLGVMYTSFGKNRYRWAFPFDPEDLLRLAIYQYLNGEEDNYYKTWQEAAWLPNVTFLKNDQINELLWDLSYEKIEAYLKLRFKRAQAHSRLLKRNKKLEGESFQKRFLVFVSRKYCRTDGCPEGYFDEEGNPNPPIFYFASVVDYDTGNLCYAYQSERPRQDTEFYKDLLTHLKEFGFVLDEILLIVDNRLATQELVQPILDSGVAFIREVPVSDESLKEAFLEPVISLENEEFKYDYLTITESSFMPLQSKRPELGQKGDAKWEFIYRVFDPDNERDNLLQNLVDIIEEKNKKGISSKGDELNEYIIKNENNEWEINYEALSNKLINTNIYILQTNYIQNPLDCFKLYNLLLEVQQHYSFFRLKREYWLSDAFSSNEGLIFLHILNQSLRMLHTMAVFHKEKTKPDIDDRGIDSLLSELRMLYVRRMPGKSYWTRYPLNAEQREALKLLDVKKPVPTKVYSIMKGEGFI